MEDTLAVTSVAVMPIVMPSSFTHPFSGVPVRTNFVLVDFESIQPDSLAALAPGHFKVLVFVGANQTKVSLELAAALQRMGDKAEYIKITGTGPNALDFHIAFYNGHLAAQDPTAYFLSHRFQRYGL